VYQVRKLADLSIWDLSTHEGIRSCQKCFDLRRKVARRVVADDSFTTWKAIPELVRLQKELFDESAEEGYNRVLSKYSGVLQNIPLPHPIYDRRQQDKDIKREHIRFNGTSFLGEGLLDRLVEAVQEMVIGFGSSPAEVSLDN
jgi:hypothetical protein